LYYASVSGRNRDSFGCGSCVDSRMTKSTTGSRGANFLQWRQRTLKCERQSDNSLALTRLTNDLQLEGPDPLAVADAHGGHQAARDDLSVTLSYCRIDAETILC